MNKRKEKEKGDEKGEGRARREGGKSKKKELTIQFMIYHLQHRNKKNSKVYKFQGRIKKGKGNHNWEMKEEGRERLLKSLDVHGSKNGMRKEGTRGIN